MLLLLWLCTVLFACRYTVRIDAYSEDCFYVEGIREGHKMELTVMVRK